MPLSARSIFKNSLPVAFAYLVLGFTFGALFAAKGGSAIEAFLIATLCFAGAAQFVSLEFYRPEFSPVFLFVTIFLLNVRHIFYGISFSNVWTGRSKIYLFMALTDENFGISSLYRSLAPRARDWLKVYALNHSYWIIGCVGGSLVPASMIRDVQGADFALIALFVAIFGSSMKRRLRGPRAAH